MQFLTNTNFDFLGKRKIAYVISGLLIVLGIVFAIINGGLNPSIDFAGGIMLQLHFEPEVHIDEVRSALAEINLGSATIQNFGNEKDILIKVKASEDVNISNQIKDHLRTKFADSIPANVDGVNRWVLAEEKVDGKIGKEFQWKAFLSVFFALIAIIIYIWVRFEFMFGLGAVVALFHDVLITLGIFAVLDKEISITIIAALLTIVGYSLNDTIVVFDRIREDLKKYASKDLGYIINKSINETLSRTLLTSVTTLLVIICLLIWGGPVVKDFALALFIGVVVGTYSSIFVASPILLEFHKKNKK